MLQEVNPNANNGVGPGGRVAGSCRNGDNCKFRHDPEKAGSNAPKNGSASTQPTQETAPPTAKSQKMCDFFTRMGSCRHGDNCKFSHVRPAGSAYEGKPRMDQKPCDFWQRSGTCKHGDNCKFLHIGPPASNTVPQQQMPPQQQQQMPPQHHLQAQQQPPAMMMIPGMGPMHGSMEAMQAYAAQAQEMANQYARQAQAFAHQVAQAQAQAHQNNYHAQGMPMTSMGMPQMPEAGFIPMVDPGFGPMGPHFGGQPQHQYGAAMPGAQEQAVLYAQKYVCTPTPPKRGESSPRQPCDFFARDGYCLHEANCMFEHVRPEEEYHPEATSVGDEMPGALSVAEAYSQAEDEQNEQEKHEHEHEHAQQENRGGAPEAC